MIRLPLWTAVAIASMCFMSVDLHAQAPRGRSSGKVRSTPAMHKLLAPAIQKARRSTVTLYRGDKAVALGTVVHPSGWILTKASEILPAKGSSESGKVAVVLGNGQRHAAKIHGEDRANDLLLLRIPAKGLVPVTFAEENPTDTGSFVVTAGPAPTPLAYGVMSVARHSRRMVAFLGVQTDPTAAGMRVVRVVEGSAADSAGLKVGDVVTKADGKKFTDATGFREAIRRKTVGTDFRLEVERGAKKLELVARLRINGDRHGPISSQERSRLWGPLSRVRLGMEEVLQHDTVLKPTQCGGPLCNLSGQVVGINIARVGRFETIAVTAKVVARALRRLKLPAIAPVRGKRKRF